MTTAQSDTPLDGGEPPTAPTPDSASAEPAHARSSPPYPSWTGGSIRTRPVACAGTLRVTAPTPLAVRRFDTAPQPTRSEVLDAVAARSDRSWMPIALAVISAPLIELVWVFVEVGRDLRWPPW